MIETEINNPGKELNQLIEMCNCLNQSQNLPLCFLTKSKGYEIK